MVKIFMSIVAEKDPLQHNALNNSIAFNCCSRMNFFCTTDTQETVIVVINFFFCEIFKSYDNHMLLKSRQREEKLITNVCTPTIIYI
jgi:hypothetical protein